MEPGNLTPDLVVMRLYEFIQFVDGETFRMRDASSSRPSQWHGPAQEIYDYTAQFHLTDFHCSTWKGGPLGVEPFLGKNHRFKTRRSVRQPRLQTGKADTNNKCINHNSSKQHSTRIVPYLSKNFARGAVGHSGTPKCGYADLDSRFCSWLLQNCLCLPKLLFICS